MRKRTIFALLLVVAMTMSLLAGCESYNPTYDTLVIATTSFEGKFNPFYAESAYDWQVLNQIFVTPQMVNKDNVLEDYAGSIDYKEIKADDGHTQVEYTIKIKKGMKYTDGTPVTIDDVIYCYYVWADPSYTGPSSTFYTEDIVGLKEYYYDDPNYSSVIEGYAKAVEEKYSLDTISKEDFITYLIETKLEGWWNGNPSAEIASGYTWSDYIIDEGFEEQLKNIDASNPDQMLALLAEVEYTNYAEYYDPATWWGAKLAEDYIKGNLEDGIDVPTITGITKVDDYTCKVLYNSVNIYGDRTVNAYLVPRHYYGEFTKGNAEAVVSANMDKPMGSGPYIWQGYADNIVTCVANDNFFLGKPYIKTVKWQVYTDEDILAAFVAGDIDIANPTLNKDKLQAYIDAGLHYDLVDNNGYGYLGINSNNVEKLVRQGFMHLLNRKPSVEGYYGTMAQLIERPMTTTLAEYPDEAKEYYGYDPQKALAKFKEAGYEQKDGKLVKNGQQLVLNVYIGGEGIGDHPGYAMLTQAANDLKNMGGELIIHDVQFSVLQAAMNSGEADIFVLAWGTVTTCDQRSQYMTGGGQNRTNISNKELDNILEQIVVTMDLKERKALVAKALDIVMEEAVEMPLYQRKNGYVYNPVTVDISSLPETSTYWSYENVLYKIKLN
ncbi:MAG: ABC transporter substrate-binding protein [Clostridiaceae bacterium]|nr:ABC transporter substrate-binding protein [Clostridiaceae bacterium]